jgi:peptide deformylase
MNQPTSILPIYLYGQPVLRKKARPVRAVTPEIRERAEAMFATMRNARGIGLAANQVGLLQRIVVVDISEMEEGAGIPPFVLINPEVVEEEGKWIMEEGCLSIPEIRGDVERAETVRVRYRDLDFQEMEVTADGILGRVLLHEIDHINGVLFIDRIGQEVLKTLKGRLNKVARGEGEINYPVLAARGAETEEVSKE